MMFKIQPGMQVENRRRLIKRKQEVNIMCGGGLCTLEAHVSDERWPNVDPHSLIVC